jgi:hypothetical protein
MMSVVVLMVISSPYFVEYLCGFRILPLTTHVASFTLAFHLALHFVPGQVACDLLDFAFVPPLFASLGA